MTGAQPQRIVTAPARAAMFLVLEAQPGAEEETRAALTEVSGIRRSVGFRLPEAQLTCVTGIGSRMWDRLYGAPRPVELHPFQGIAGPRHTAVATPGDLLFHIRARHFDLCFELAQRLTDRLRGHAVVVDEVHGFRSFDERDLLGFVDGTENPEGADADAAVLIADEDPEFAGGSYVIVQKYVHDLTGWDALGTEEQERAIGRTKLSNIEFDDAAKPADAHIALTVIEDGDGEQQQIVRHNMPFGRVGAEEYGTYFIGYARSPAVIERMLVNMFLGDPTGATDRILDFSTAVTGGLFFVPSTDRLDDPPPANVPPAAAGTPGGVPMDDGSLQIGSLRRSP